MYLCYIRVIDFAGSNRYYAKVLGEKQPNAPVLCCIIHDADRGRVLDVFVAIL